MKFYKIKILIVSILLVLFPDFCLASTSNNFISDSLFSSAKDKDLYEVGDIVFIGNISFTPNELLDAVNSKKSSLSLQHDIFQYYYDNFQKIPSTPKIVQSSLNNVLNSLSHEIKYFNEGTAELDVQTLWNYYNINGFHFADISYSFIPDLEKKYNVLQFYIEENERYLIDTIVYLGLENIDKVVSGYVESSKLIRSGDIYNEQLIMNEVNSILNILLNSGYFYVELEVEPVFINTVKHRDSITVNFKPGKRQKITKLNFVDSLNEQNIVVDQMKNQQLDFKVGEWYSRHKVQSSINNLHSLGTFELVSIDTSSTFYPLTDTTLSIVVFTKYRKQKEWGVGVFVNNTQIDQFTNVGIEANLMHRNWGGAAQSGNIFANVRSKNVSRFIAGQVGEYEGQIGFRLAQPLVWSIENMRIGATGSFYYSLSTVDRLFNISAWFFPVRFPIKLTNDTYLNQIIVDFNFEFQNPTNYLDVSRKYIDNKDSSIIVNSDNEIARLEQAFLLYSNLYNYLNRPGVTLLTSNILGISLLGDSRNHPFSPTMGDNFFFSVDGWNVFLSHPWISGIAKYLRAQVSYNLFLPMNENSVSAFKIRAGVINLVDDYNAFVPFDRQFFAGGANSVRGWLSRELHYSPIESAEYAKSNEITDYVLEPKNYSLLSNILGNSVLIEGSYEWRYTFPLAKGIDEVLAEQISKIGLTFFVDYGNAYHWYIENDVVNEMKWYEYFTKLAWAAGIGIRYNTPIGPIRLDFGFPIYRPGYNISDYYIWKSDNVFRDMKIHFGIGHAF